ncbi:enoyl-CoA hydratase-related protein [Egicoccus halophilus]|uniref:Enoyl-CoA hydratase n=1 Tax=Egicoccus halophilus TaxID=1670830 RepID=A0A8J3EVV1_9ACTN|nr:enoyl-CoA hydratase-related protein [Egicoccus halophilus]GGI08885.1 enoyl-CoA hydratase [Egicoccus halophilus]
MAISREVDDAGVLTITLDDGEKNALVPETFDALIDAFDADTDAQAVVLAGRPGIFTAGLNVKWMAANGGAGVERLLVRFGECLMRVWTDPRPTVCAATGHAIAAGTMFAMACDHAVAAEGGWWGLTETQIDFELPEFGIALARHNVRTDRLEDLLLPGRRIDAAAAVEAGFADEVVAADDVLATARARAAELASLPSRSYAGTKRRLRATDAQAVLAGLPTDIAALTAHLPV